MLIIIGGGGGGGWRGFGQIMMCSQLIRFLMLAGLNSLQGHAVSLNVQRLIKMLTPTTQQADHHARL